MKSKEALLKLCFKYLPTIDEMHLSLDEEDEALLNCIQKNLEILELLKNRISLKENTIKGIHFTINEKGLPEIETDITKAYDVAFIEASGFVFKNSKEYTLLKEWLENE